MKTNDDVRVAAAMELADALVIDFTNPGSALKGINGVTLEKLLVYLHVSGQAQRCRSKSSSKAVHEAVAEAPEPGASE